MDETAPIILYDGDCAFCNRWVVFVLCRDADGRFRFAALNSETARTRLPNSAERDGSTLILLTSDGVFTRSTAVLRIAAGLNGYGTLARLLLKIPQGLRDAAYSVIARHRRSLAAGRKASCAFLPGLESRFLP